MRTGQIGANGSDKQKPVEACLQPGPFASSRRPALLGREQAGDLVRKASKGDEGAWAELLGRFGPMVLRVAQQTGLNAADAADVQQATWIQLLRGIDQIRDPERIGAWLATTARRQSQRIAMAGCRIAPSSDPLGDSSSSNHANEVEAAVMRRYYGPALERALEQLPVSQREIITLLTSDEAPSYEHVAERMSLPVGSIGPMRIRGLKRLRHDPSLRAEHAALRPPAARARRPVIANHPTDGRSPSRGAPGSAGCPGAANASSGRSRPHRHEES